VTEAGNGDERISALEADVAGLRADLTDLRGDMDREFARVNEQFVQVDRNFAEVRGRLDATAAGQQTIVDLLGTVIRRLDERQG
jgi:hypothetical protein